MARRSTLASGEPPVGWIPSGPAVAPSSPAPRAPPEARTPAARTARAPTARAARTAREARGARSARAPEASPWSVIQLPPAPGDDPRVMASRCAVVSATTQLRYRLVNGFTKFACYQAERGPTAGRTDHPHQGLPWGCLVETP